MQKVLVTVREDRPDKGKVYVYKQYERVLRTTKYGNEYIKLFGGKWYLDDLRKDFKGNLIARLGLYMEI